MLNGQVAMKCPKRGAGTKGCLYDGVGCAQTHRSDRIGALLFVGILQNNRV